MKRFKDRVDAGKQLAAELEQFKDDKDTIIIALPRGGVVPAYEVATALHLPLDIIVTRKIGAPTNPELAIGAITSEGEVVWNEDILKSMHIKPEDVQDIIEKESKEAARRLRMYRGDRPPLNLKDKNVIVIDDGIATGATMLAAIMWAQVQGAQKVIVAVPIATVNALEKIEAQVDKCVCLFIPKSVWGISAYYEEFPQTTDEEVIDLLHSTS